MFTRNFSRNYLGILLFFLAFVGWVLNACSAGFTPVATATPTNIPATVTHTPTPGPTSTPLPEMTIMVSQAYYFEDGVIVQNGDFEPRMAIIYDFPVEGYDGWFTPFEDNPVVGLYTDSTAWGFATTGGTVEGRNAAWQDLRFYMEFTDGTFAELAFVPPPAPECIILGVLFSDSNTLNVGFEDFDGNQKTAVFDITEREDNDQTLHYFVEEVEVLPFFDASLPYGGHSFAESLGRGFAALIGQNEVGVYAPNDFPITDITPCVRG